MNKRIREIHRQVMLWSDTPDCPDTVEWKDHIPEEYTKKFAESLIQECAEVAYNAYWKDHENIRGIHIKEAIQKHFGVEE